MSEKSYYLSEKPDCIDCPVPDCDKKNCLLTIVPEKISKELVVVYNNKQDMPLICNKCDDFADKENKICILIKKSIKKYMEKQNKASFCPIRKHFIKK